MPVIRTLYAVPNGVLITDIHCTITIRKQIQWMSVIRTPLGTAYNVVMLISETGRDRTGKSRYLISGTGRVKIPNFRDGTGSRPGN